MSKSKEEQFSMLRGHDEVLNSNIGEGEDNDGNYYFIFDTNEEIASFIDVVNEVTGESFDSDSEVESYFDVNIVYSDEYTKCSDCNSVIRTDPTHYGWQPDFYIGDGFIVCNECFNSSSDYQEDYLEERINNPKNAVNGLISEEQLMNLGFRKSNDHSYESGLHDGQNDDPERLYDELSKNYDEIVFTIDRNSQFDIEFSAWVRGEH